MLIRPNIEKFAKIKVVGVGGAGGNAVNYMVQTGDIVGVDFMAINTDKQALSLNKANETLQIGAEITGGLGSGAMPEIGKKAAEESRDEIRKHLEGYDMVFITAGMGGGTGTGASGTVATLARELGALTIAVVTKPFNFEGTPRQQNAERGIKELKDNVDALITIPNQKLLEIEQKTLPLREAFAMADNILAAGVRGISDLIVHPGLINVDFADVKTIMQNAGSALMGIGRAEGEGRAEKAADQAIHSPLLDIDIAGATGILINIIGDDAMTLAEVETISQKVSDAAGGEANIIFGASPGRDDKPFITVTVIATGFETQYTSFRNPYVPSKEFESPARDYSVPANTPAQPQEESSTQEDLDVIIDDGKDTKDPYRIPPWLRRS
jgi:cell division protein FtsZ